MARKKKPTEQSIAAKKEDSQKINEWIQNNKVKVIPDNQGGDFQMKGFFGRRKKNPFKKAAKVETPPAETVTKE